MVSDTKRLEAGLPGAGAGFSARVLSDGELKRFGIVKAVDGQYFRASLHAQASRGTMSKPDVDLKT